MTPAARDAAEPPRRDGASFGSIPSALLAFVAYCLTSSGLIVAGDSKLLMHLLSPIVAAIVCGTLSLGPVSAGVSAAAGVGTGAFITAVMPVVPRALTAASSGVYAGALAAGIAWWCGRRRQRRTVACALGLVIVIANLWWTAWFIDGHYSTPYTPTLFDYLRTEPAPESYYDDNGIHLRSYYLMRERTPYHSAFRQAFRDNATLDRDPPGVFGYRLPTLFLVWSLFPDPVTLVALLGVLTSIAVVLLWWALRAYVPDAVALASSTAVATYMLFSLSSPMLLFTEPWAAPFAIGAVACLLFAERSSRPEPWWWVAGALACAAALIREHAIALALGGLAYAAIRPRRFGSVAPWLAALVVFAAVFAAHAMAVGAVARAATAQSLSLWRQGGPAFVWSVILYSTSCFGTGVWLATALAAAGLAGIAASRAVSGRLSACFVVAIAMPLVGYLFVGGQATTTLGEPLSPWGATVTPLLYVTAAFVWRRVPVLNGSRPERRARAGFRRSKPSRPGPTGAV